MSVNLKGQSGSIQEEVCEKEINGYTVSHIFKWCFKAERKKRKKEELGW